MNCQRPGITSKSAFHMASHIKQSLMSLQRERGGFGSWDGFGSWIMPEPRN